MPTKVFLKFSSWKVVCVLMLLAVTKNGYSQLVPISLEQRIDSSTVIFEGKVIAKSLFGI